MQQELVAWITSRLRPVKPRSLFGLKDGVRQDSSDAAAPCHSGDPPGATEPSQRHLAQGWLDNRVLLSEPGAPQSLVPCQTHRHMPGSTWDGCKDLGWLWAVPECWQGSCSDMRDGERARQGGHRAIADPWGGRQPESLLSASLPPMAFRGK